MRVGLTCAENLLVVLVVFFLLEGANKRVAALHVHLLTVTLCGYIQVSANCCSAMSDQQLSEADRRVLQRALEIVSSTPNVDGSATLRSRDTTPTERSCNDQEGTIVLRRAAVTPHRAAINLRSRCGGSKQIEQHVAEYVCHPTTKLNFSSSRV